MKNTNDDSYGFNWLYWGGWTTLIKRMLTESTAKIAFGVENEFGRRNFDQRKLNIYR